MIAALLLSIAIAAPELEQAPMWLTFDVLNPESAGNHSVLHLDDVLSERADIPDLPISRGVLLFATTLAACNPKAGVCAELATIAREVRALGGLVVALLLDPAEALLRAKTQVSAAQHPFPVIQDTYGIVRHALTMDRPGEIVVINSDGKFVRLSQATESAGELERKLGEAKKVLLGALRRDKED